MPKDDVKELVLMGVITACAVLLVIFLVAVGYDFAHFVGDITHKRFWGQSYIQCGTKMKENYNETQKHECPECHEFYPPEEFAPFGVCFSCADRDKYETERDGK